MAVGFSTPLLDLFRKGEIPVDVRRQAAQGLIATRTMEQLALLAWLTRDDDASVRSTAERTISRIPRPLLTAFLQRADVPQDIKLFFSERGFEVKLASAPAPAAAGRPALEFPLFGGELDDDLATLLEVEDETIAVDKPLEEMTVPEKLKAASRGNREIRAALVRDSNRIVMRTVLSNPRLTESEVEAFARMQNISEDALRIIGSTRAWIKNYNIVSALVHNPKCPLAISLTLMQRLVDRDIRDLSTDHNIPEPLRVAARKRMAKGRP